MLIAFNKPFGVLSQFTSDGSPNRPLAEFNFPKNVYPIGRLDADSEGLLLLSDEPEWNERLLHPRHAHEREYWAQVERIPTREALDTACNRALLIQGRKTLPCRAWLLEPQPEVGRVTPCAPHTRQQKHSEPRWRRARSDAATADSTTSAADPFSQERAGLLDRSGIDRGQEPSGAAHDGGHRASDVALAARADWWLETG